MDPSTLEKFTRRMSLYESYMWGEIIQWEHENKGTLWDQCTTMTTKAIKACVQSTGASIPASVTNTIRSAVEKGLHVCFTGSMYTVAASSVLARAKKCFGCDFNDIKQLRELELAQLDELAASYATTNQILALLEGAGMGLGGLLFIAADIPALITINLRMLIQLAFIYGIDVSLPAEREFVTNIIMLASADQKDRHGIFWQLDQAAKCNIEATILSIQIEENIVNEVMKRMVGTAHRIALKLSHTKIAQLLPVVGLAIGAGGNYAFARETTHYGMMILRKRWLMHKHDLVDMMLQHRDVQNERLMTSWVMVDASSLDGNSEGEDDVEFEEDFRPDVVLEAIQDSLGVGENKGQFHFTTNHHPQSPLYPDLH
eukprot:Phypoly_transcript_08777.p1 GENE.Phypoly_transcript_08777~~Phypoly_transcript_08777.p1  ORF type:complete len:372 (+),score=48.23 Phypoly_transcript_08777:196-1311(+)